MLSSFLLSLFSGVDVTVRDEQLYCDTLCEQGPDIAGKQVAPPTLHYITYEQLYCCTTNIALHCITIIIIIIIIM